MCLANFKIAKMPGPVAQIPIPHDNYTYLDAIKDQFPRIEEVLGHYVFINGYVVRWFETYYRLVQPGDRIIFVSPMYPSPSEPQCA